MTEDFNCPSDSSACSGADARLADKRSNIIDRAIDDIRDGYGTQAILKLEELRSAVSPRSSDGLLPCPFCGAEVRIVGVGKARVDHKDECFFVVKFGIEKTLLNDMQDFPAWDKRAAMA